MTLPQEYRQWLNANLNWYEKLRRKLSPDDEAFDFMAAMLFDIAKSLKEPTVAPVSVDGNVRSLVNELGTLNAQLAAVIRTFGGEAPPAAKIDQISFRQEVAPLQGVTLSEQIPDAGHIMDVIIHWPPGSNGLVGVSLKHGTIQFLPSIPPAGTLALDDVTQLFRFWEPVKTGERLYCEITNGDNVNSHTISVIAQIQR